MAAFEYTALEAGGRRRKGVLEADSVRQVRQLLRDQGLAPLAVQTASDSRGGSGRSRASRASITQFRRRLSGLDRVLVTRQLATLIGAGMPVEEALDAVAQQSEKQYAAALVMGIRSRVLEGRSLASALADFPTSFNALYRSTVAAGEQSGHLDRVLENLADYTERQFEAWRNVQMALLYPVVLLVLAMLIVGALMVFVVPDMVRVLDNMGRELPAVTQFLIGASAFVQDWWWALLLVAAAAALGGERLLRVPALRLAWDRQKLNAPFFQAHRSGQQRGALRQHPKHPQRQRGSLGGRHGHRQRSGGEHLAAATAAGGHPTGEGGR